MVKLDWTFPPSKLPANLICALNLVANLPFSAYGQHHSSGKFPASRTFQGRIRPASGITGYASCGKKSTPSHAPTRRDENEQDSMAPQSREKHGLGMAWDTRRRGKPGSSSCKIEPLRIRNTRLERPMESPVRFGDTSVKNEFRHPFSVQGHAEPGPPWNRGLECDWI